MPKKKRPPMRGEEEVWEESSEMRARASRTGARSDGRAPARARPPTALTGNAVSGITLTSVARATMVYRNFIFAVLALNNYSSLLSKIPFGFRRQLS